MITEIGFGACILILAYKVNELDKDLVGFIVQQTRLLNLMEEVKTFLAGEEDECEDVGEDCGT